MVLKLAKVAACNCNGNCNILSAGACSKKANVLSRRLARELEPALVVARPEWLSNSVLDKQLNFECVQNCPAPLQRRRHGSSAHGDAAAAAVVAQWRRLAAAARANRTLRLPEAVVVFLSVSLCGRAQLS